MEKIQLRPQKKNKNINYYKNNGILIKEPTKNLKKYPIHKTPSDILNKWELFDIIISYTSIVYYNKNEDTNFVYFTTKEIKYFYNKITSQQFNKIFGEDGMWYLLFCRNGVKYDHGEDVWCLYPDIFFKYLRIEYIEDEETYGKNFCKN